MITHREPMGTVDQATSNVRDMGVINPLDPYLFPWLSSIAGNYDKYQFLGLTLEYVPLCATSTAGQVILAWDPAANDGDCGFMDLYNMHSTAVQPWMPAILKLPGSTEKYMGEGGNHFTGASLDMYNHGRVFVGTNGSGAAGTLFVSYKVKLTYPQPATTCQSVVGMTPLGSTVALTSYTSLAGFQYQGYIPSGTWKLQALFIGTGITAVGVATGSGVVYTNVHGTTLGAAITDYQYSVYIKSFGALTSTIVFTPTYTTLTTAQFRLTRIDAPNYADGALEI